MKITLDLAISADGFIARLNGDSDWVDTGIENFFKNRAREAGCLVVGRTTFEQYQGDLYPVEGAINIVLTSNPDTKIAGAFSASSPAEAVALAEDKGCAGILVAGGARTSAAFLEAGLIDEIFFSVHPLILGQGMKPFEGTVSGKSLALLDSKNIRNGLIELHYKVLK
jgi:dihydrofolate reductase